MKRKLYYSTKGILFPAILLLFILLTGCHSGESHNEHVGKSQLNESYELIPTDTIAFYLDSTTALRNYSLQYFEPTEGSDSLARIVFLNKHTNTIYFYPATGGNIIHKIKLSKEGPDGVGWAEGIFVKTLDSIFVQEYSTYHISLIDSNGKRYDTYNIDPFSGPAKRSFLKSASFPMEWHCGEIPIAEGSQLYFAGTMNKAWGTDNVDQSGVLIKFDINKKKPTYLFHYPPVYNNAVWPGQYRWVYMTYNPFKDEFVFSFPAADSLYVLNKKGKVLDKEYAGSKYFGKIPLFSRDKKDITASKKAAKFFLTNPFYGYILFDKYKNVYYRFAYRPISADDYKNGNHAKPTSIIILNKKLAPIGEFSFPDTKTYSNMIFFISPGGINLLKYSDNEDVMSFVSFKLNKIK